MVSSQWHSNLRDQPTVEDTAITTDFLFLRRQPTKYHLQSIKKKNPFVLVPMGLCEFQHLWKKDSWCNPEMWEIVTCTRLKSIVCLPGWKSTTNKDILLLIRRIQARISLVGGYWDTQHTQRKLLRSLGSCRDFLLECDWEETSNPL